jgi:hypothetical protein
VSSFEVHGGATVQLRGPNGELLFTAKSSPGEFACRLAIVSIRFSVRREERIERRVTPDGQCYLVLRNHEGVVLGESPPYESTSVCDHAARRMRLAASEAKVVFVPAAGASSGS